MSKITAIGLDLAKTVFQAHGCGDDAGQGGGNRIGATRPQGAVKPCWRTSQVTIDRLYQLTHQPKTGEKIAAAYDLQSQFILPREC